MMKKQKCSFLRVDNRHKRLNSTWLITIYIYLNLLCISFFRFLYMYKAWGNVLSHSVYVFVYLNYKHRMSPLVTHLQHHRPFALSAAALLWQHGCQWQELSHSLKPQRCFFLLGGCAPWFPGMAVNQHINGRSYFVLRVCPCVFSTWHACGATVLCGLSVVLSQ